MNELASTLLLLRATRSARLPGTNGFQCYAAILSAIRAADPFLAERLKAQPEVRLLTVSPLLGVQARGQELRLEAGSVCGLRITAFDDALCQLLRRWQESPPPALSLTTPKGSAVLEVQPVCSDQSHPLIRWSTFTQLYDAACAARAVKWEIEIDSPATFHVRGGNLPLPVPRLVYNGLLRKWLTVAPIELRGWVARGIRQLLLSLGQPAGPSAAQRPGLPEAFDGAVRIEQLELRTLMWDYEHNGGKQTGFLGRILFCLPRKQWSEIAAGALTALTDFAYFAGVGANTAMGMGQVGATRTIALSRAPVSNDMPVLHA